MDSPTDSPVPAPETSASGDGIPAEVAAPAQVDTAAAAAAPEAPVTPEIEVSAAPAVHVNEFQRILGEVEATPHNILVWMKEALAKLAAHREHIERRAQNGDHASQEFLRANPAP